MSEQQIVRASTPAQWLTTVPYLLGFQPHESIVVLGVGGPNGKRITLTLRVDVCDPSDAEAVGEHLVGPLLRAGAAAFQVFLYRDAPGPLSRSDRDLLESLCDRLAADLRSLDHVAVLGDRWFPLDPCPNLECCPPEGSPMPEPDERIRAELVYAGLSVLPSREDLVGSLAPIGGPATVLVEQRADEQRTLMWEEVAVSKNAVLAWGREVRADLADHLAQGASPLPTELLARFLAACTWLPIRDGLLIPLDADRDASVQLLTDVVRRAPRSYVAGPATLLGLIASLQGEGGLANVAFDRALEAAPDYSFAVMLQHALAHGVRMPDDFIQGTPDPLSDGPAARRRRSKRGARRRPGQPLG
jgi:hypothetical protein